jgi:hypothetical protein
MLAVESWSIVARQIEPLPAIAVVNRRGFLTDNLDSFMGHGVRLSVLEELAVCENVFSCCGKHVETALNQPHLRVCWARRIDSDYNPKQMLSCALPQVRFQTDVAATTYL